MTSRLEQLQKFLEEEPADAFTHYAIALEYASMGKLSAAVEKLEEVIILEPNYVAAYHQLGILLARMNNAAEAVKAFERGIEIAGLVGDTHARSEMEAAIDEMGQISQKSPPRAPQPSTGLCAIILISYYDLHKQRAIPNDVGSAARGRTSAARTSARRRSR